MSESPVLLAALAQHLPTTFAVRRHNSQPSMNNCGRSVQIGCDDHLDGTKANLWDQQQQKSSNDLCTSANGVTEQSLDGANILPEGSADDMSSFDKTQRDVLLFCRVNSKEPYVFMGRSHSLPCPPVSLKDKHIGEVLHNISALGVAFSFALRGRKVPVYVTLTR